MSIPCNNLERSHNPQLGFCAMKRLIPSILLVLLAACVQNTVFLPNTPGGPNSDLSAAAVRQEWVDAHPDIEPAFRDAILEGVFIDGMSMEMVNLISNPARRATAGNAFWRRFTTGDEVRLRWYVRSERLQFLDGRNRAVCELVLVEETVTRVMFCEQPLGGDATPGAADPAGEADTTGAG